MKKSIALVLIAILCLLLSSAAAEGGITAEGSGLAAYLDGSGNLLIPGNPDPVNQSPADSIISIDPYRLVYTGRSGEGEAGQNALVCLDLSSFEEKIVHENVHAACMTGSFLYYVPADSRTELKLADLENGTDSTVLTAQESIGSLYMTAEGLVVSYVEDAGALIYIEATDSFEPYGDAAPRKSVITEDYQLFISDSNALCIHRTGSAAADTIDVNVFDFALLDGKIYYLANTGSAMRVKSYDPGLMEQKVVCTPEMALENQLTASLSRLFTLGMDGSIYTVNPETAQVEFFSAIQPPQLEADKQVDSYFVRAMNGQLNVYAEVSKADNQPVFTFTEFASDAAGSDAKEIVLVESIPLEGEEPAWTLLQPAAAFSPLSQGSRGDAVAAIQKPLFDHKYYDYYIDGIFGYRTDNAIRLLQGDVGHTVNGIADADLQRMILSGNFPVYDPYLPVSRGDNNLRVLRMQQRLRTLGYLADGADGIFGGRTQAAVQLFQNENNLAGSGTATRETLMKLFADSTARCSSYIDLRTGDSGWRVRELNKRLKELFYLEGSVGEIYTTETAEAIRIFQQQTGLTADGMATVMVQQRLFAQGAPERLGYSELRRGDENSRVARLQRRLRELNYFTSNITGYFGKNTQEAVKLFQQKVGMRPSGVASIRMQELLFSPDAPVYVKPTVIGTPAITIDVYDKRENGVYYMTDESSESGYVSFGWSVEGDITHYNVRITDDQGNEHLNQDTLLKMTSVPVISLELNRVYTLKITAYPADGNEKHITSAELSFCRVEAPEEPEIIIGTITDVFASVETVTRTENDVHYVKPGSVIFRWYAEGDVASYHVEIRDSDGKVCLDADTTDEQAAIQSDSMKEGEIYTLNVYAIPTNGTMEHAVGKTLAFTLETVIEPVRPASAPVVTIDGADMDENGGWFTENDLVTLRWDAVENAAQYHIEIRDAEDNFCTNDTTTGTSYDLDVTAFAGGSTYTLYVTAIAEGGSIEEAFTTAVTLAIAAEEPAAMPLASPEISIEGVQLQEDGMFHISSSSMTVLWNAVENAAGYRVMIGNDTGLAEEVSTVEPSAIFETAGLTENIPHTLTVEALPADEVNYLPSSSTIAFIIESVLATEETVVEDAQIPPAAPVIEVDTIVETIDDVRYLDDGDIVFRWHSESAPEGYYAEILDGNEVVLTSMTTENETAGIHSDNLEPGIVYTLRVTALPGAEAVSFIRFARFQEPTEVITEDPAEEIPEEPADEAIDEPIEETKSEIIPVTAPVIDIQPVVEIIDSVHCIQAEEITFSWYSEGPVSGYALEMLLDETVLNSAETNVNTVTLSTEDMTPGAVYMFRVTAIPEGGTAEDGTASEALLAFIPAEAIIAAEATEEPTPVPTEEPTPEPTEEPTPEPTEDPTPEPTEEPTPEPTEEPTPEPTEEPTPEPTIMIDEEAWLLPMNFESDPMLIEAVQLRLVELEWLLPETFEPGVLDEPTLLAVYNFQVDCNTNFGGELILLVLEGEEPPVIEIDTLAALMLPEEETNIPG